MSRYSAVRSRAASTAFDAAATASALVGSRVATRGLRALFSTNDRSVQATEAFTNRSSQWEPVAATLTEHLQHINSPGIDAEDLEAPRNHVLVFHGVGGIGKTTLSRMLEAALTDAGRRPSQ
ncbi:hypothetical protein [Streptomyces sp. NPDC046862]|uniref:hypothetical protein n=1 Tax=Streptomyces sp. NPDC046862 TaxID=3154603 RepID=UPI00345491E7